MCQQDVIDFLTWLAVERKVSASSQIKDKKEYRRYHLHDTVIQKATKKAVNSAHIMKRASAHTFRHLLQENYDIRTIQELLGHSDIRTTMRYTHTLQSRTIKQAKSPLDFTSESKQGE
ncbi:MAG: site-specific integrase [gamma proteobacterium symbiont of Taylorina sp.]|nr:site-specific integrase [gamma proteobacterium symbiont of Taylorina sp.]